MNAKSKNNWTAALVVTLVLMLLISTLSACGPTTGSTPATPSPNPNASSSGTPSPLEQIKGEVRKIVAPEEALGEVRELQARVDKLNDDWDEVAVKVKSLQKEVDTYQGRDKLSDDERSRINQIYEQEIPSLKARISELDAVEKQILKDYEAFKTKWNMH